MSDPQRSSSNPRRLLCLAAVCAWMGFGAQDVTAQPTLSLAQRTFTLSQPGKPVITDVPIVRTASSAVDFYDYRSVSSHTGLEVNQQSTMFLHYDISQPTNPISLIITHGIDQDSSGQSQPTATVNMDIINVPTTTTVTFSDDGGEFTKPTSTTARGRWVFANNTDGGILGAFPDDQDWEITMSLSGTVGSSSPINAWTYTDPVGTNYPLDFDQPFTITYSAPSSTSTAAGRPARWARRSRTISCPIDSRSAGSRRQPWKGGDGSSTLTDLNSPCCPNTTGPISTTLIGSPTTRPGWPTIPNSS